MSPTQQLIKAYQSTYILSSDMTLEALRNAVEGLIAHYGPDATIDFEADSDSGYISETICFLREETDVEQKRRLKEEEAELKRKLKADGQKEQQERKLYEKLRKKYEKSNGS